MEKLYIALAVVAVLLVAYWLYNSTDSSAPIPTRNTGGHKERIKQIFIRYCYGTPNMVDFDEFGKAIAAIDPSIALTRAECSELDRPEIVLVNSSGYSYSIPNNAKELGRILGILRNANM